jgi:hypothetical protein
MTEEYVLKECETGAWGNIWAQKRCTEARNGEPLPTEQRTSFSVTLYHYIYGCYIKKATMG